MLAILKYVILFILMMQIGALTYSQELSDADLDLLQFAFDGDISGVIQALKDSADINAKYKDGETAIFYASLRGHSDLVKILQFNGADIDPYTTDSLTPFLAACMYNYPPVASFLHEKGANINAQDIHGAGALHFASAYNYILLFSDLKQWGINLFQTDKSGNNALITAAYAGHIIMCDSLINNGLDINSRDKDGYTPLMIACQRNDTLLAKLLLEKGAKTKLISNIGISAISLATEFGSAELMKLLIKNTIELPDYHSPVNPVSIAWMLEDYDKLKLLKKSGYKMPALLNINRLKPGYQLNFNHQDFLSGPVIGIHESRFSIDAELNFNWRLIPKRILVEKSPDVFYQYWERRYVFGIALYKHFVLFVGRPEKPQLYSGLKEVITFGNYKGTYIRSFTRFIPVPEAGLVWNKSNITELKLGLEYFHLDPANIFPLRALMSYSFFIPVKSKIFNSNYLNKPKQIGWLN